MTILYKPEFSHKLLALLLACSITLISLFIPITAFATQHNTSAQTSALEEEDAYDGQIRRENAAAQANTAAPQAGAQPTPVKCDDLVDFFSNFGECFFRSIAAGVGTFLVSMTAWLLTASGALFDWLVEHTIVKFGAKGEFYDLARPALDTAWTAVRDLANIVIIGMFTFIAISIILGLKEYGKKVLIAKVIVIAVLINFSLIFTKVIIDASNFTARQFHQNTQIAPSATAAVSTTDIRGIGTYSSYGVAGQFINFMGITSVADTYKQLEKTAEVHGGWWMAFIHGFFSATVLLVAALVLLYGSFLLVSRAILLIVLLTTSAFAFATYLIPKAAATTFGWNTWWSSLLKTAAFAPLMMIFLWVTVSVAQRLKCTAGTLGTIGRETTSCASQGSLGQLVMDPAQPANLNAFFTYLIVLGLLFISFRVASSFSKTIANFNWASAIAGVPLGLAARGAGFVGRQTIGRVGAAASRGLADAAKSQNAAKNFRWAKTLDWGSRRFQTLGTQDYNVANTAMYKAAISKPAGLTGTIAGETSKEKSGGILGREARMKKAKDELATRLEYTNDELEKMRTGAMKKPEGVAINTAREENAREQGNAKSERATIENNLGSLKGERTNLAKAVEEASRSIKDKETVGAAVTAEEKADLTRKQETLNQQDAKITDATQKIEEQNEKLAKLTKEETEIEQRRIDHIKKHMPKNSVDEKGNINKDYAQRREETAVQLMHTRITNPFSFLTSAENDRLAQEMRKRVRDSDEEKHMRKMLTELKKMDEHAEERGEKQERQQKTEHAERKRETRTIERAIRESGESKEERPRPPSAESH